MLKNSCFLLQNRCESPVDTSPRISKTASGAPWETEGSQGGVKEAPGGGPGEPGGAQGGQGGPKRERRGGPGGSLGSTTLIDYTSRGQFLGAWAPWGMLNSQKIQLNS